MVPLASTTGARIGETAGQVDVLHGLIKTGDAISPHCRNTDAEWKDQWTTMTLSGLEVG